MDVAGDAATAALTAVSAAADEAQARLAAKARMRELEHAVVTARAGGRVVVSPPTREEALRLAGRVDPGSSRASVARGVGFILAGIAALVMTVIGGFGWLGVGVPITILVAGGWLGNQLAMADRGARRPGSNSSSRAPASRDGAGGRCGDEAACPGRPQCLHPRGDGRDGGAAAPGGHGWSRTATRGPAPRSWPGSTASSRTCAGSWMRPTWPRSSASETARRRAPPNRRAAGPDRPREWLLRQICIDYLPGALEHYISLPPDRASEPVLDGRSARQVLDEQLALIERRLDQMATRTYQREAGGLLTHARFLGDVLRPDPFQARLAELAGRRAGPGAGALHRSRFTPPKRRRQWTGRPAGRASMPDPSAQQEPVMTDQASNCRRPRTGTSAEPIPRTPALRDPDARPGGASPP